MFETYPIKRAKPEIIEINEVAGMWEVKIEDCPIHLKIKVFRTAEDTNYPYIASPNYSILISKQDPNFKNTINHHTIQEAFENSLNEFFFYYNKKEIDHTDFKLNEDW